MVIFQQTPAGLKKVLFVGPDRGCLKGDLGTPAIGYRVHLEEKLYGTL